MKGLVLWRGKKRPSEPTRVRPRLGGDVELAGRSETESESVEEQEMTPVQEGWTHGSVLTTRVVSVALGLCVIAGPAALAWRVIDGGSGADQAPAAAVSVQDLETRRGAAEDVAVQWVLAWLSATQETPEGVAGFYNGPVSLPAAATVVHRTSVTDAQAVAPGVWSVTVGADVELTGAVVRRYYQVPVSVDGDAKGAAAQVMAVPAVVTGPAKSATPRGDSYATTVAPGTGLHEAAEAFLGALLIGEGDITRFATPGTDFRAISAPFGEVEVLNMSAAPGQGSDLLAPADGDTTRALVDVVLTETAAKAAPDSDEAETTASPEPDPEPGSGQPTSGVQAQYQLSLTARAGRWEVTSIDQAPTSPQPSGTN